MEEREKKDMHMSVLFLITTQRISIVILFLKIPTWLENTRHYIGRILLYSLYCFIGDKHRNLKLWSYLNFPFYTNCTFEHLYTAGQMLRTDNTITHSNQKMKGSKM